MKNGLFVAVLFLIPGSHVQANSFPNCQEPVKIAARTLWSINSNIDMKDLTAEIRGQKQMNNEQAEFSVVVNTPRFPEKPQNVRYLVLAGENSGDAGCFIRQITAADQGSYGH